VGEKTLTCPVASRSGMAVGSFLLVHAGRSSWCLGPDASIEVDPAMLAAIEGAILAERSPSDMSMLDPASIGVRDRGEEGVRWTNEKELGERRKDEHAATAGR
jgi:hypothetical protein